MRSEAVRNSAEKKPGSESRAVQQRSTEREEM
jgi:hypothetical protein